MQKFNCKTVNVPHARGYVCIMVGVKDIGLKINNLNDSRVLIVYEKLKI